MKKPIMLSAVLMLALSIAITSCKNNHSEESTTTYIPEAPNYNDSSMWITALNDADNTGADIFYVVSTWEFDWQTAKGETCHYADPVGTKEHRDDMAIEINKIAGYMAEGNNFYAPYYRHITLESWATFNEDTINNRFHAVAFEDLQRAFRHFLDNRGSNRPFIIAGFSQGGKATVELIKTLTDEEAKQMAAAYVLGYKVTPEDTTQCKYLKGATGETDLGRVICYNSVDDISYRKSVVCVPCAICINPVNWRTDATPATLHDTITVTLDPEYHVLVLDGYSGSEYRPILNIANIGDFHGAEPWLYQDCLSENIRKRTEAYRQAANSNE